VWIGAHVSILKGSQIAHDSIVATRATVTKAFARPNIIIGGSPAGLLKEEVSWTRLRFPR
jgi:acetyltransferase-like isoleucine patch superfamily enzyme